MAFTNKAIENIKEKLIDKEYFDEKQVNSICYTFDMYFCEWINRDLKEMKDKTIFIEEFSMMTLIYKTFIDFKNTIYLFGDSNQCDPVEKGSQIHYDYICSKTVNKMCPKSIKLEYIEKSSRYNMKTHLILHQFLKDGKLSKKNLNSIDDTLYKNISYLNKTRIEVNNQCCERFTKDKEYKIVDFLYNNKKESYKVCEKMPIIATKSIKDKNIFNTMEFTIKEIIKYSVEDSDHKYMFYAKDEAFDENEFRESFIPSFCVTVYKYQGASINNHYNIHDVNRMDKK